MLRPNFIRKKIELIHEDLGHLDDYAEMTFDKVAQDWRSMNIVERVLEKQ